MSIENTSQLFPEGPFDFEISQIPEKKDRGGTIFWEFQCHTELDGSPATYTEFLPIWLCGPMFRILGFKEIRPGSFDVEPTLALGKRFSAIVVHEEIKSGNKAGQVVSRLKDMLPSTVPPPIPAPKASVGADDIPF